MKANFTVKHGQKLQVSSPSSSNLTYEEDDKPKKEFIQQRDSWSCFDESDGEDDSYAESSQNKATQSIKKQAETEEIIEMQLSTDQNGASQDTEWKHLPKQESNRIYYYENWHSVDIKYLLLVKFMAKYRLINLKQIAGIKEGYVGLNLKSSKMSVRSPLPSEVKTAIIKLSDYIDKLYVMSMDIQSVEVIRKIDNFIKLRCEINRSKIVLFSYDKSSNQKELYIGGEIRPSELKNHMTRLRNSRISCINLRCFRNKRSYCVIVDEILKFPQLESAMFKFNQVKLMEVARFHQDSELKLVICSLAKRPLLPQDYQEAFINQISKFLVLTFVFESVKLVEVMSVPNVTFKIMNENKFPRSYLFVICLKENFNQLKDRIVEEISKVGIKITGVRFFCNVYPEIGELNLKKEDYSISQYPPLKPYSWLVTTYQNDEKLFDWREYVDQVAHLENKSNHSCEE